MRPGSYAPALRGVPIYLCAALWAAAGADAVSLPDEPSPAALAVQAAPPAAPDMAGPGVIEAYGPLGLPCEIRFQAAPAPGGTALLRLEAPCQPGVLVTVAHGALSVSLRTSASGGFETVFPAFAEDARYDLHLPDGTHHRASVRIPGTAGYERVVTMWQGEGALSVHAYEYGAGAGEAGHVWRGAPRGAQAAEAGRGGFLMALGAEGEPSGRRAEVYTFPAAARAGTVRIALAAAVTPANCGGILDAETLQIGDGLPGAPVALRVALPGCDAAPGDLVLKNLARDLKIAAR